MWLILKIDVRKRENLERALRYAKWVCERIFFWQVGGDNKQRSGVRYPQRIHINFKRIVHPEHHRKYSLIKKQQQISQKGDIKTEIKPFFWALTVINKNYRRTGLCQWK